MRTLLESVPNFSDLRKSHDFQITSSFRETDTRNRINHHKVAEPINSNNMNKAPKGMLKITPLNERRSQTRQLRANTLTRNDYRSPKKPQIKIEKKKSEEEVNFTNLVKVEVPDEPMKIDENEQLSIYSLFTKIFSGALERLGGDEQLQLA